MAQTERISTAIRELMSRGEPPTSPRAAYTELVAALAGNVPHPLHSSPISEDLERRSEHPEKMFAALHIYLTGIIADAARNIPGGTFDRGYLDRLFQQFSADALRVIRDAAAETRGHENWRTS